jgi:hypothetical protein
MEYIVYLTGEIHTDWRDKIKQGAKMLAPPTIFTSVVINHEASQAAGDGWCTWRQNQ